MKLLAILLVLISLGACEPKIFMKDVSWETGCINHSIFIQFNDLLESYRQLAKACKLRGFKYYEPTTNDVKLCSEGGSSAVFKAICYN